MVNASPAANNFSTQGIMQYSHTSGAAVAATLGK
jgi:hypothetical protein